MKDMDLLMMSQTSPVAESVKNVLDKFTDGEIVVPDYQRDSDQWSAEKKSLFIESILLRITIPAHYLAPREGFVDISELVDGQQRITTLDDYFSNKFALLPEGKCAYYGSSIYYAGARYEDLDPEWRKRFKSYDLTLVRLPSNLPLELKLETFRRINMEGSPLSPHDIRLGYYSSSLRVRFIQLCGVYDIDGTGSKRMLESAPDSIRWPWSAQQENDEAEEWKNFWSGKKTANGQKASTMFLWFLVCRYRKLIDRLLENEKHLKDCLNQVFRNENEQVLDLFCAQLLYEEQTDEPYILPSLNELAQKAFPRFSLWFSRLINHCPGAFNASKYRAGGILIAALDEIFGDRSPSEIQWQLITRHFTESRALASELGVKMHESKGRWLNAQRPHLDDIVGIALRIRDQ